MSTRTALMMNAAIKLCQAATRQAGVPIGIENDKLSGGKRVVYHRDGKTIVDWQRSPREIEIPGPWVNVDARLGVVTVAGGGMAYRKASGYNAQAVCADVLYGSFSDPPQKVKAGDEVVRRIALCFAEVTPEETAALAKSVKIANTPKGKVLHFGLPEGGEAQVPLL